MSSEQPQWMGCAASDETVQALPFERFARTLGSEDEAWSAAHATLLHQKPVRFEMNSGDGFYIAPFDPNMIGLPPRAIIVGHLKLETIMPRQEATALATTGPAPACIEHRFLVRFLAQPRVFCETFVYAGSAKEAAKKVQEDFDGHAHKLARSVIQNLERRTPVGTDFEFVEATRLP